MLGQKTGNSRLQAARISESRRPGFLSLSEVFRVSYGSPMVPGAGAGCQVPLLARTAELRGPAHLLPRAKGRATFRGFGGYFGGANKRCTHWWLK